MRIDHELQVIRLLEEQIKDLEGGWDIGDYSGGKMTSEKEEWLKEYRERLAESRARLKKLGAK